MALNDLLAALARDARVEARELLRAGYAERKRVMDASREQIETLRSGRLDEKRRRLQSEMQGEVAAERRRSRLAISSARDRLILRVLERASQSFEEPSTLARLSATASDRLREILAYAEGTTVEITSGPSLSNAIERALEGTSSVEVVVDDSIETGWIVRSSDHSLRIDDTLSARMERLMPQIRMAIVAAVGKETQP